MLPLVTRRHHDAEVEALRTEITNLVNVIIETTNDLTLTKASLTAAIESLKEAKSKLATAESRADWAMDRLAHGVDFPVPVYPMGLRVAFHTDPGSLISYRPVTQVYIRTEPLCYAASIDMDELQAHPHLGKYVLEIVAKKFGREYGKHVEQRVWEALQKEKESPLRAR